MAEAAIPFARPPLPVGRTLCALPPGACDAHVHLFAGPSEFPRDPGRSEEPAPGDLDEWSEHLLRRMDGLGLERAVLVHSIIYRENNAMTCAALRRLGSRFRGVALLASDVSDRELDELHGAGFRGVRLDLVFPGRLSLTNVDALLPRLAERGWHLQVFGRWGENADAMRALVDRAPCPVIFDHFAYPDVGAGRDAPSFRSLLATLRDGAWIKLSSLYRQAAPPFDELLPFMRAAVEAAPDRVVWGSNWPHVRWAGPMPDETSLVDLALRAFDGTTCDAVFARNPARLYNFPTP